MMLLALRPHRTVTLGHLVPAGVAVFVPAARGRSGRGPRGQRISAWRGGACGRVASHSPRWARQPPLLGRLGALVQRPAGFFLNGMEPSSLLTVILAGLSTAGSNSKRCNVGAW